MKSATARHPVLVAAALGGALAWQPAAAAATASGPQQAVPASRLDTGLRAFLDEAFAREMALSPQRAASLGLASTAAHLDEQSDEALLRRVQLLEAQRADMHRRFPAARLSAQGRLDAALFDDKVARARSFYTWRYYIAPSSIDGGPEDSANFLINRFRIASPDDARSYIACLRETERVLGQLADRLDRQRERGIAPTARQLERLRRTLSVYTAGADNALLADFRTKIAALKLPAAQEEELLAAARDALDQQVRRGQQRYGAAIAAIAAHPRPEPGMWSLPQGDAYYAAALRRWNTTDLSAEAIHQLGLQQVARLKRDMNAVLRQVGYAGSLADFSAMVRTDPRFHYTDDDAGRAAYLADARRDLAAAIAAAPRFFRRMPRAGIEVRPVEKWREQNMPTAVYDPASPDGARAGTLYINQYDLGQTQKVQLAALVHHEGVPGHHVQVALAQETDLPRFRRFASDYGSYIEGWALYSEALADEMGLYQDPYSRFGMLSLQMWRACRLVLDTGIHAKRWSREQALAFFKANSSMSQLDMEREVDRYIGSPGQATAYMIGELRILALRDRAKQALGRRFDIRDFHDVVLRNGAMPIGLLEAEVNRWIASRRPQRTRPRAG